MSADGAPPRRSPNSQVRSLVALKESASSSRVLNLIKVWEKDGETKPYAEAPLFLNAALNRALIVKHRLRDSEHELFADSRTNATKIIMPLNATDLRAGGWSFFVGQINFEMILKEISPETPISARDRTVMDRLDGLPSLDPFLMRERLRNDGVVPARCYFEISDADTARMLAFTEREMTPLIGLTFGTAMDAGVSEKIGKLARRLLGSGEGGEELEPLRVGMGMDKPQFDEGMFCWRGFLYYKWSLSDLAPQIKPISEAIMKTRPFGPMTDEEKYFVSNAKPRLVKGISRSCNTVRETLNVYDRAYAEFTANSQPAEFRNFLLKAPSLFQELGERIGALQHLVSFWRYRFPMGAGSKVAAEEFCDILRDFDTSLDFGEEQSAAA